MQKENKNNSETQDKKSTDCGQSCSDLLGLIEKTKAVANNALYFDDSSDYDSALWEILNIVAPDMFKDKDGCPDLEFIEEKGT